MVVAVRKEEKSLSNEVLSFRIMCTHKSKVSSEFCVNSNSSLTQCLSVSDWSAMFTELATQSLAQNNDDEFLRWTNGEWLGSGDQNKRKHCTIYRRTIICPNSSGFCAHQGINLLVTTTPQPTSLHMTYLDQKGVVLWGYAVVRRQRLDEKRQLVYNFKIGVGVRFGLSLSDEKNRKYIWLFMSVAFTINWMP